MLFDRFKAALTLYALVLQAVISSRRLSNFLSTPEHHSSELTASADLLKPQFQRYTEVTHNPMAFILRNVCCSWSSSSVAPNIVLRDISLQLKKGLFIAIVGEVIILTGLFSFS
jgi:ATP-binding cassette subfamily C (CFTR/MRP) protein 10